MTALYDSLTDEERLIVHDPSLSPKRPGVDYPLTVGDMAAITGATERKIRNTRLADELSSASQLMADGWPSSDAS